MAGVGGGMWRKGTQVELKNNKKLKLRKKIKKTVLGWL